MALKRQRRAQIFQERRNVFEMFGDEQLMKQVTFISVIQNEQRTFTLPKNIITDFSLAHMRSTLYDE